MNKIGVLIETGLILCGIVTSLTIEVFGILTLLKNLFRQKSTKCRKRPKMITVALGKII
jgi:hypothetical protein